MFYVINKSKIYSYLIALCTVAILFVVATTINDMASPSGNIVETGANIIQNEMNQVTQNDLSRNPQNVGVNHINNQVNAVGMNNNI